MQQVRTFLAQTKVAHLLYRWVNQGRSDGAFLKVTLVQKKSTLGLRSQVPGLSTLPGGTTQKYLALLEPSKPPGTPRSGHLRRAPGAPAACTPQDTAPRFSRAKRHCTQAPGRWPRAVGVARVPPREAALTVALGPDKQGHALQPLHVAGRHMPGAPVVPLPVLVERVNLHPPPGVGHRAVRGQGREPGCSRPGTGSGRGGRPQAEDSRASLLPVTAAGPRRRPHGQLRGPSSGPPPSLASGSAALLSRPGRPAAPKGARGAAEPPAPPR